MVQWALIFFVISVVTGGLGFTGLSNATSSTARMLCFIAIVICVIFLGLAVMADEMQL